MENRNEFLLKELHFYLSILSDGYLEELLEQIKSNMTKFPFGLEEEESRLLHSTGFRGVADSIVYLIKQKHPDAISIYDKIKPHLLKSSIEHIEREIKKYNI